MGVLEVDGKGRILLPRKDRERIGIGKRVLAINMGDHIRIIPVPEDPIAELDGALSLGKPFKELRRQAEERAAKEAGDRRVASHRK